MRVIGLILLILLVSQQVVSGRVSESNAVQFHVKNNQIVDGQGRERFFHGVNVVSKNYPYIPETATFNAWNSFSDEDVANLKSWGQNIIRLGVMWTGVFPADGQVNNSYIAQVTKIIQKAGQNGIFTLIDMHQDLFSEKFCADGVPMWLLKPDDYKNFALPLKRINFDNQTGEPLNCYPAKGGWSQYYFTFDVARSFQKLYTDVDGWRVKWGDYWALIAERFHSNPYVIGYELINEPWCGNFWADPSLLLPGVAEKKYIQAAYEYIAGRIREFDDNHIIFFEGITWDNWVPVGFTQPPGGQQYANRSVLSYHYYFPPDLSAHSTINARVKDAQRLNISGMMTEFWIAQGGTFPPDSVKTQNILDNYLQSWIGWSYKPYTYSVQNGTYTGGVYYGNGTAIPEIVGNLSRSYPQAVAGKTISFLFTPISRELYLSYNICLECGSTDVYINEAVHYPKGFLVNILPQKSVTYVHTTNLLMFNPTEYAVEGEQITIIISANQDPFPDT